MITAMNASNPVVFFANGLGDHFLNLPTIRALGKIFQGRMTLVSAEGEQGFLWGDVTLRRVIETRFSRVNGRREFPANDLSAQIGECDLFISLVPWHSKSLGDLVCNLSPDFSVGFHDSFDLSLPLDFSKHSADLAFDVVRHFDTDSQWHHFAQPPVYPEDAKQMVNDIRQTSDGFRALALHVDTLAEKMWSTDRFASAISIFLENHPEFMTFILGWNDYGLDRGPHDDRIVPLHKLKLAPSWYLVGSADLFLGVDSCFLHAADFSRVPSVGLFGPTNHKEFGFKLAPNITLQANGSMDFIEVADVVLALENMLFDPNQSAVRYIEGSKIQN